MLDADSRTELGARWAYRAGLEHAAAHRFAQLADRLEATGFDGALVTIARHAAEQERTHVGLCAAIAERFGATVALPAAPVVPDIAPRAWSPRDRVAYEVVAFCCVTETANAVVVTAGVDDVDDRAIRRALRTILADEVQHSRLGWRFLASHPLDDAQRAGLAVHLPSMLAGTVRADLFTDALVVGDEETMRRFGTLPRAGRRDAFVAGLREVLFPGLAAAGIDPGAGAAYLDRLARA